MPLRGKLYVAVTMLLGAVALLDGARSWAGAEPLRFALYLGAGLVASGLKVRLPGITGTMSVNYLFILMGIVNLTLAETMMLGCCSVLVQYLWHARERRQWVKVLFNAASISIAADTAFRLFHASFFEAAALPFPLRLGLVAAWYFLANTLSVATVVALTEGKSLRKVWHECYFWAFPYYILGAAVVGFFTGAARFIGWPSVLLTTPAVYLIYRSYRLYLGRLEAEKRHAEEMASLHLRTIEALALAIEAKDHTTHDHLRRVQVYACEIGREMGLTRPEIEALRASALLHDIGKLGVPEHIISKPGRLTAEEFEKMKVHPLVGAEILDRVQFPYPVAPIVRSHHERWDGSGYPIGLKGEEIPIGARILSAVDCLDALASDRQYRRAVPLDEAMAMVAAEAGKSYDPDVVDILRRRYTELEAKVRELSVSPSRLTEIRVHRGESPAAGLERAASSDSSDDSGRIGFLDSIAAARQEVQFLYELTNDLGNSLSLNDTLSVFAARLGKAVPFDGLAVYLVAGGRLKPEYVTGDDFRLFSSLEIPIGEGLSGWVAENRSPILNGTPSVEPGYLNDQSKVSSLRSALAVPLEALNGVVGVLALYRAERDAFTRDHLRILQAIQGKLALSIENNLKFRVVEDGAATDYLTGLPNARSLFHHLQQEVARHDRSGEPLVLLACDLDGFKQVNDRFGHLAGNRLLRRVAEELRKVCRDYDFVARMGGDEFVAVLPGVGLELVPSMIERFQFAVRRVGVEVCREPVVSISIGWATLPGDPSEPEKLLTAADLRMYRAKKTSRDLREAAPSTPDLDDIAVPVTMTLQ